MNRRIFTALPLELRRRIQAGLRATACEEIHPKELNHNVYSTILLRSRIRADSAPYRNLECLSAATARLQSQYIPEKCRGRVEDTKISVQVDWRCVDSHSVSHSNSVFEISGYLGLHNYVEWAMKKNPSLLDKYARTTVPLCFLSMFQNQLPDSDPFKILELFLSRRSLSSNTTSL